MTTTRHPAASVTSHPAASVASYPADRVGGTRAMLGALAVAGPLWAAVSLTQAATRDGFDLTRHPLSLLSTGALGWLQITNFVLAGILLLIGATGLRRTITSRWAPRLVRISGAGMLAAGVLVMDPADGYPIGTPAGMPATMSWHSIGHMAAGSVTFIALIAACYVLARHFRAAGAGGTAVAGAIAGTALLAGDTWAMTGSPAGSATLAVGAITAMCFLTAAALHTRR